MFELLVNIIFTSITRRFIFHFRFLNDFVHSINILSVFLNDIRADLFIQFNSFRSLAQKGIYTRRFALFELELSAALALLSDSVLKSTNESLFWLSERSLFSSSSFFSIKLNSDFENFLPFSLTPNLFNLKGRSFFRASLWQYF